MAAEQLSSEVLLDGSLEVEVQKDVTFVWLKSSTGAVLNSWILNAGDSVTVSPLKLPFQVSAA